MERQLTGLFLVAALLGSSACIIKGSGDADDPGGSPASGGSPSNGGGPSNGGNPSNGGGPTDGGSGAGVEGGSTGNQGGAPQCDVPSDCPLPKFECSDPTCPEGNCQEEFSEVGSLCSAGICDGFGYCVECVDDFDCPGTELCDVDAGVCYDDNATGPCADSFCIGLQNDNDCAACIISENQVGGSCQAEWSACAGTGSQSGCSTCSEFVTMGENQGFCAGSQIIFQDYLDCICSPAACLD